MFKLLKGKKKTKAAKILVVDDEPDLVDTIQCRLEWSHYKVITARNGKEGLEKAITEKPDLVLLDIRMPVMNGHEVLERMRKHHVLKDTPVIMVTGFCDAQDIATASSFGIEDYVAKPFDLTELVEKIAAILKKKTLTEPKK